MSAVGAAPERSEASGTDLDEAGALLTSTYGAHLQVTASDQPFTYRYTSLGNETMSLRTSQFDGNITGSLPPSGEVIVQWLQSGTTRFDLGQDVVDLQIGIPLPLLPDREFSFQMRDYDQRLVHLDRALVERVAAEQGADMSAGLRFDHTVLPSEQSVRTWHNTVALVSHTLQDGVGAPLLHAEMGRLVSAGLLEMYPQQRTPTPSEARGKSAHVRAAVEFVHANAHTPITTSTLADAVGLGLRALQEAFQRDLRVSPNVYIRQVRLDRVRQELHASRELPVTVREVAAAWGFAHYGRFVQQYTDHVGEHPDTTRAGR